MQTPNQGMNNPDQNPPNRESYNPQQDPYRAGNVNNPQQGYNVNATPQQGYNVNATPQQGYNVNIPQQGYTVAGATVPSGLPFDQQEWQTLLSAPMQISVAMMSVSPSGPIGMLQEAMAIGRSIQSLQSQGQMSPFMAQIGQSMTHGLEGMRSGQQMAFGDVQQMLKNPPMARASALSACQQVDTILAKASPQDALAYKQFIYTFAHNVAAAGREGGFLGLFGGEAISEAEQSLLMDIVSALRLQRS